MLAVAQCGETFSTPVRGAHGSTERSRTQEMEPLSLHIGGASTGLPLPPALGPLLPKLPSAGLALPDAREPSDASDDEIGVDDLLGFGGADADASPLFVACRAVSESHIARFLECYPKLAEHAAL